MIEDSVHHAIHTPGNIVGKHHHHLADRAVSPNAILQAQEALVVWQLLFGHPGVAQAQMLHWVLHAVWLAA